jgi:hypothetical protein
MKGKSPTAHVRLSLYDCAYLDSALLESIAYLSPNLKSLKLKLAGRLSDLHINLYSDRFASLTNIHLSGCYLVTEEAWTGLFTKLRGQLVGVGLEDAAKLSRDGLESLCGGQGNTNGVLKKLVLKRCHKVGEDAIRVLAGGLTSLSVLKICECGGGVEGRLRTQLKLKKEEVSEDGEDGEEADKVEMVEEIVRRKGDDECNDDTLVSLLKATGTTIRTLSIEGFFWLGDAVLEGIREFCPLLTKLSLADNQECFSKEGLENFFAKYQAECGALVGLDLSRQVTLNDVSFNGMSMLL